MTKKKARLKQTTNKPQRKSHRKALVVISLILCLGLTSAILAHWRATRVAGTASSMAVAAPLPQPQPALSPSSPSKEYIYAGGRLIATEEPQSSTGSNERTNFALASNGGVASASSSYSTSYPASRTNNGDRKGPGAGGNGDYWNDGTQNTFNDELTITFNSAKTIDEVDLFCLQDSYNNPSEPTQTMTFTLYGLTGFNLQYWTGTAWAAIPGASASGNNLVWKKFTFPSLTTSKVKVVVTASPDGWSRVTELEAWGYNSSVTGTNVALASNGGVASASSSYSSLYPAGRANNGDRKGPGSVGDGDYWNDSARNTFPDWLQIDFSAQKTIHEIDLYCLQDSYWAPSDPTETMTFTYYGLRDFKVQYWTGSAWMDVTGGNITSNNKVWRKFAFSPISTTRIRVLITATSDGWSRITELEAWGS